MARLRFRYNPAKGLAGQTLADLVNTTAVIAGLGAAPELRDSFALFWALGIVIGALTLGVAYFQWRRGRMASSGMLTISAPFLSLSLARTWYSLALATAIVGLFAIAASVTAVVMTALSCTFEDLVPSIVGWPAYLSWIAAEAVNVYENATLRPKTRPSILSLVKSILQMLGALLMYVYVVMTLRYEPDQIGALFWSGAGVAIAGTLLGVVAGLLNLRRK